MNINTNNRSNSYVRTRVMFGVFILCLIMFAGFPAVLSVIFTIPSIIIIGILYLSARRSNRSFEARYSITVLEFYKAVWVDKKNRKLGEIIDELKGR